MRLLPAMVVVLAASLSCGGKTDETKVQVVFKSSQLGVDYSGTAVHALAVPQATMIKVYLFPTSDAGCGDVRRELDIASLYLPQKPGEQAGVKFAPPRRPSWAGKAGIDRPLVSNLKITGRSVSGCLDTTIDEKDGGNAGTLKGCFHALTCPPNPVDRPASGRGSANIDISMEIPGRQWSRHVGNAIAFLARDRLMVFFQDAKDLTCENYRLLEKQGLVEFLYAPGRTSFDARDVVKLSPVDPDTGWSFHFGRDLLNVSAGTATISADGTSVKGMIDVTSRGVDPLSMKEFFHDSLSGELSSGVTSRVTGSFEAPVCPEF